MDQEEAGPVFSATSEVDGTHLTVVVSGEVDMSTAEGLTQAVSREGAKQLTLDLRGVTFFDSAGVQALVRLARRYPGGLTVLPSRQVRRVLDISGLAGQEWLRYE